MSHTAQLATLVGLITLVTGGLAVSAITGDLIYVAASVGIGTAVVVVAAWYQKEN